MSETEYTQTTTETRPSLRHVTLENIPAVCTLRDVAEIFDLPMRSLRELRSTGQFPIPTIPGLGRRVLFSGQVIRDFLTTNGIGLGRGRR